MKIAMKKLKSIYIIPLVLLFLSSCYLLKKSTDYYGIDTSTSKRIVYLIDISGSMEGKAETDLQGNIVSSAGAVASKAVGNMIGGSLGNMVSKQTNKQMTKLAKARKELIPSIRGLSEDTYFTIIVFENQVKKWRKELVQASSANKALATTYIEKLESGGGTNISDALEEAFILAGTGATDSSANLNVETVFLLSDGEPTAGKITSPEKIISKSDDWNSAKRVKIYTIGLGEDCDKEFMKELANKNNGSFIDR